MKKSILAVVLLAVVLTGCKIDVEPTIPDQRVIGRTEAGFLGIVDTVTTFFPLSMYECVDGFTYDIDNPGVALSDLSGADIICNSETYDYTIVETTTIPLYNQI
ncbi:MAG: hypothetical protein K0U20_08955 [Proteobacteria bacterium]|nr:hypothetical protein [Pseudomonadota bacterium]